MKPNSSKTYFKNLCIQLGFQKPPLPLQRRLKFGHKVCDKHSAFVNNEDSEFVDEYPYPRNYVQSSRYTIWSFVPQNLFEQFQRIANFYFLCIVLVQLFIDSSVPIFLNILPLIVVLSATMAKQGYEDFLRHKADRQVNNVLVELIDDSIMEGNASPRKVRSMDVCVGDVLMCRRGEVFPCDLLLVASSDPGGCCFVTTASLDGETNLKVFSVAGDSRPGRLEPTEITCEQPSEDLYRFNGFLRCLYGQSQDPVPDQPLSAQNLLLRGARLCDTEFVLGLAIYTGPDTKVAMNSRRKPAKFSAVELRLNYFLVVFLVLLVSSALLCTVLRYSQGPTPFYVDSKSQTGEPWPVVQTFLSFLVLLNYLIPISLYVTVELQKFAGAALFGRDLAMYHEESKQGATANTSDLNEELGQVSYVFSDKTGTLTENVMRFRCCSVLGDTSYRDDGDGLAALAGSADPREQRLQDFLLVLALCHTARPVLDDDGKRLYQASSPDEKAFVEACQRYGIEFMGLDDGSVARVKFAASGKEARFRVLTVLEFDSDRKRMSIVLENEDGTIDLLCKGAETAMFAQTGESGGDRSAVDVIMQQVTDYAVEGLRTLVIGRRRLSREQFTVLLGHLKEAQSEAVMAAPGSQTMVADARVKAAVVGLESQLELLGCTGVEDQLQDGVAETIVDLRAAGIQVWILTGDKEETAVNISHSTGHFNAEMQEIRITQQTYQECCLQQIDNGLERVILAKSCDPNVQFGFIVDGQSLALVLNHVYEERLQSLLLECVAVLCCRMTPLQKSAVVRLVKTHHHSGSRGRKKEPAVTLAIGDGANDVSMILEAHVGIGLYGKEGRQAVRSADYALARFCHLRRALLLHGQFYYCRLAVLVHYFFYKNSAFIAPQLFFAFFSGFSAQTVYESLYLVMYNISLTSLPILAYGLLEQHLPPALLLSQPRVYHGLRANRLLRARNFLAWNLCGLWHACVALFGPLLLFSVNDTLSPNGHALPLFGLGTLVLLIVWLTVSIKLCLIMRHLNLLLVLAFLITFIGNIALFLIYQSFLWPNYTNYLYLVWTETFSLAAVWLCVFVCILLALTPDILWRLLQDRCIDRDTTTHQEQRVNGIRGSHRVSQSPVQPPDDGQLDNSGFEADCSDNCSKSHIIKSANTGGDEWCYSNPVMSGNPSYSNSYSNPLH